MFLHIYRICPGSGSEFVSLHADPDPAFIIQIRIRITAYNKPSQSLINIDFKFLTFETVFSAMQVGMQWLDPGQRFISDIDLAKIFESLQLCLLLDLTHALAVLSREDKEDECIAHAIQLRNDGTIGFFKFRDDTSC